MLFLFIFPLLRCNYCYFLINRPKIGLKYSDMRGNEHEVLRHRCLIPVGDVTFLHEEGHCGRNTKGKISFRYLVSHSGSNTEVRMIRIIILQD